LEWMKKIDFLIHVENIIKKTLYNVGQKYWKNFTWYVKMQSSN
jgi:hypothetical protein